MKLKGRFLLFLTLLVLGLLFCAGASAEIVYNGQIYSGDETLIDLGSTVVKDMAEFESFLKRMPALKQVNMFATKVEKGTCHRLAKMFPDMKWGWTMVLRGSDHTHEIRTDQTSFSTLHNNRSSHHRSADFEILKYCWHLYALDFGHNSVDDLSFLYDLPELRVLIAACNQISDITPVASLHNLEYAELFKNQISNLSPVKDLTHLLDLNVCFNRIKDISPLKQMTWLKRLWLLNAHVYDRAYTKEEIQAYKAALPDTEVDMIHYSTAGTWRYIRENKMSPHYAVIVACFGSDHLHPSSVYVPFEDSWPFTPEEREAINQAYETFGVTP